MFLATFDFEYFEYTFGFEFVKQELFVNEFKSCEISNQMFFNAKFSFLKTKDENDKILQKKQFSGAISHGAPNEPDTYLEPSQLSTREHFC